MILYNVEIMWPKLIPSKPDPGYKGSGFNWCVDIITRDDNQINEWLRAGLNVRKLDKNDFHLVKLKSNKFSARTGKEIPPPTVVDQDAVPYTEEQIAKIGNGTIVNVQLWSLPNERDPGKSVFGLNGIQIVELKEYKTTGARSHDFKPLSATSKPHSSNPTIPDDDDDDD